MVRYNGWIYSGYICSWMREHKPTCTVTGSAPSCTWATMFYWAFFFSDKHTHVRSNVCISYLRGMPRTQLALRMEDFTNKVEWHGWCQNTDETCVLVYVYKTTYNIHVCSLYIILYPHWPTTPHRSPSGIWWIHSNFESLHNIFCTFLTNTLVNWHVVPIFVGWLTSEKSNDPHLA